MPHVAEISPIARTLGNILAAEPLVYLSGRWAGMDLLAGPNLFGRVWPHLCAGYAADAIRRKPSGRFTPSPSAVVRRLSGCPVEAAHAVGLGTEYRLTGQTTVGTALIADDRLAHLRAFPVVATQ